MKWIKEHDIVFRVLAVLMAVLLWIYVMRSENPDMSVTYNDIALRFEGIQQLSDNSLTIISGADTTISVKMIGKRDRVMLLSEDKINATVNVSSVTGPGEYSLYYGVSSEVEGVSLNSKQPTKIKLVVDRLDKKTVPIDLEIRGKLPDGYELSSYTLSADGVGVSGPESILAGVSKAKVMLDVNGKTDSGSTTLEYVLLNEDGKTADTSRLTTDIASVTVNYSVTYSDSVPLTLSLQDTEGLTADMVEWTLEPKSIHVRGSNGAVSALNRIDLGSVSLRKVLESAATSFELPITLPNGITATPGQPSSAVLTVTVPGYEWSTMMLDESRIAPCEGLTYPPQQTEVLLFGTLTELAALTADDLTLTPMPPEELPGEGEEIRLAAEIDVPGGHIQVLGSYTVRATADSDAGSEVSPDEPAE